MAVVVRFHLRNVRHHHPHHRHTARSSQGQMQRGPRGCLRQECPIELSTMVVMFYIQTV